MIASLLADLETNHPYFVPFFACQPFLWLGTSRKPALSQEWCQNFGVIADEAGVAVEAIKAWGIGVDGLVAGMGIWEKRTISKLRNKRLCL